MTLRESQQLAQAIAQLLGPPPLHGIPQHVRVKQLAKKTDLTEAFIRIDQRRSSSAQAVPRDGVDTGGYRGRVVRSVPRGLSDRDAPPADSESKGVTG